MARAYAQETATVGAPPAEVYAVLADYRDEHPRILPRQFFGDVEVLEGGYGAGTVFRVETQLLGTKRTLQMVVSEPEPGRTLVETDQLTDLTTSFTVTPAGEGRQAQVRIATSWETSGGIGGLLERLLMPVVLRRIYRQELRQLDEYLRQRAARASS